MNYIYFLTAVLHFLYINIAHGLHFRPPTENSTLRYVKTTRTTLIKWTVQLSRSDLNSKTQAVWVRLEKLMKDEHIGRTPDPTAYVPVTLFRKITDLMKSSDEYVKKIHYDEYEIGFYITAKRQEDSGYYRLYIKTDEDLDYFSFPYLLEVVEPPKFIGCLRTIEAKTSEVGNNRFDKTLPRLHIQSSCVARGHPAPKVYCLIEKSNVLAQMLLDNRVILFTLDDWDGVKPTIKCIADGGPAGVAIVRRNDYFVFHKPIAPQGIKQLPSYSKSSIRFQWKHLSKDDAGGEIYHYVIHYRALWYGRPQTIFLSSPKAYHRISNKDYYVKGDTVYYELKSLATARNYSISLQVWNIQGRRGYITDTVMRTGYQVPIIDNETSVTSTHLTKSTTMIIATFALAGLLILLLLVAILYRRRMHIRRARCQCASLERTREQRDFFNMVGSVTSPFVLPSYEEAVRTKPTEAPPSFEDITDEPFQELRINGQNNSRDDVSLAEEPSGVAPPPYPGRSSSSMMTYVQLHNT